MTFFQETSTQNLSDTVFKAITIFGAGIVLIIMGALFIQLIQSSMLSLKAFGFEFLYTNIWDPIRQ